jgi:hypothetical protein
MSRFLAVAKVVVISAALACALAYAVDSISVRVRAAHPTATSPYETLTTTRVLAIPEKNNKVEYQIDAQNPEQTVTCVHALFPHDAHEPCWYLKRNLDRPIPMLILRKAKLD